MARRSNRRPRSFGLQQRGCRLLFVKGKPVTVLKAAALLPHSKEPTCLRGGFRETIVLARVTDC